MNSHDIRALLLRSAAAIEDPDSITSDETQDILEDLEAAAKELDPDTTRTREEMADTED